MQKKSLPETIKALTMKWLWLWLGLVVISQLLSPGWKTFLDAVLVFAVSTILVVLFLGTVFFICETFEIIFKKSKEPGRLRVPALIFKSLLFLSVGVLFMYFGYHTIQSLHQADWTDGYNDFFKQLALGIFSIMFSIAIIYEAQKTFRAVFVKAENTDNKT